MITAASTRLLQLRELDPGAQPKRRVEVGQRLVEQEQLGLLDQRAADRDALALAARQLRRACGRAAARSRAPARHRRSGARSRRSATRALLQPERHVLAHAHVRVERVMLEHHRDAALARRQAVDAAAFEPDLAGVGGLEPGDDPQQGRLARSRRAEEGDELARFERQATRRRAPASRRKTLRTPFSSRLATQLSLGAATLQHIFARQWGKRGPRLNRDHVSCGAHRPPV